MDIVAEMLAGVPKSEIVGGHWSDTPKVLRGGANAVHELVPSADICEIVVNATRNGGPSDLTAYREGVPDHLVRAAIYKLALNDTPTVAQLNEACGDSTLVINGIHRFHEGGMKLMHALFDGFSERMTVNLYYSPAGSDPGLGLHYDLWEVFAAHLQGSKHWRVWPPTGDHPVQHVPAELDIEATEPIIDEIVVAGDVLYVPRGSWHLAKPCGEPVMHLTIGVHTKMGLDVGHWLLAEASKQRQMRLNVPSVVTPADFATQLATVQEAIDKFRALVNDENAAKAFLQFQFRREYADTFGLQTKSPAPGKAAANTTAAGDNGALGAAS
jgi:ribosomal protein L16 Arg81 hydroxylase